MEERLARRKERRGRGLTVLDFEKRLGSDGLLFSEILNVGREAVEVYQGKERKLVHEDLLLASGLDMESPRR